MKIITTSESTLLLDERGQNPMELMYGDRETEEIDETARELSLDRLNTPVHVLAPVYDVHGKIRFWLRMATYVNARYSTKYDHIKKIDLPL